MAIVILNASETPPGGWKFLVKETGMRFQAHVIGQMLGDIRRHLRANGIEEPADLEEQICEQTGLLGTSWCGEPPPPPDGSKPVVGIRDLRRGLETIANMVMDGGIKFVDQAEADRRAAICIDQCTGIHHIEHAACLGCSGFGAAVKNFAKGFHAAREGELRACGVCKCHLSARVLVSNDQASLSGVDPNSWPTWCWQKPAVEENPDRPSG